MNWKLILFVVFAFVFLTILAMVQIATKLSFGIIVLPQLAPLLAFILIVLIFKNLYRPVTIQFNKIILLKAFIALILPLVLFTITYFIGILIGNTIRIPDNVFSILIVGLIGMIIGATAEEIGWRSFLQPTLEQKYSVLNSSLIVGLIWGIWHIGHYMNGLIFMLVFLMFTISVSIVIMFLLKNTRHNIIISALLHFSINLGVGIYFAEGLENIKFFFMNSSVWLMVALITILYDRKYYLKKRKRCIKAKKLRTTPL
jgi:membrane protease YdiL (CAAX protease family)